MDSLICFDNLCDLISIKQYGKGLHCLQKLSFVFTVVNSLLNFIY